MAISTELFFSDIDSLNLDPMSPRVGRRRMASDTPQKTLLDWMAPWKLDELALSYIENGGFWSHEPLIVAEESLYRKKRALVVVEGNRRVAALVCLKRTIDGDAPAKKWSEIVEGAPIPKNLFTRIPFLRADSRDDVQAYLGFKHVTGIKQWDADEKAGFITHLIDSANVGYKRIARKIGSKTPAVRRHYIAYKLLLQIEATVEDLAHEKAVRRFTILYNAIQTLGAQAYLGLDVMAEPRATKTPVSKSRQSRLAHFCRWLYGTKKQLPLIRDPRDLSDFGDILMSEKAIEYLENHENPIFEVACKITNHQEVA